jgi:hypothetical protein
VVLLHVVRDVAVCLQHVSTYLPSLIFSVVSSVRALLTISVWYYQLACIQAATMVNACMPATIIDINFLTWPRSSSRPKAAHHQ